MATDGEGAEAEARPQPSQPRPLRRTGDFLGKHRLSAAISRLNQEIQYLQVLPSTLLPALGSLHQVPKIQPGTGGSNVSESLTVVNGGHTKVLLMFLKTGI
ncbi:hypothetical protein B296_00034057 [Ensete ventricosum]|uniref:Uncharacterized protein n=1 Tax=Ensete ventricosum TaxID=4639 RepID=A0A426Y4W5_ENSVE|nr:hypothetical protein B296_00034057 [Ensete ventricosum]